MADLGVLNRQVQEYDQSLENYQRAGQQYNADVKGYNAALDAYNKGPAAEYNKKVKQYNAYLSQLDAHRKQIDFVSNGPGNPAALMAARQQMINEYNTKIFPIYKAKIDALDINNKPSFDMAKPEFTAQAPTAPSLTNQQLAALQGRQSVAEQSMTDTAEKQGLIARMQGRAKPDSIIGGLLQNARYST